MRTCFTHSKLVLLALLALLFSHKPYCQENLPYIAVIPFSAINVSESDAAAITGLFETALVKTGEFRVIEQAQMNEILKVQEFSLSDCTSEECAVEIGQLLSAEQIILGTLSSIGGKFVLTTKIVDVAKGLSLKADKVERPSLADMTEGAEVLAYKLAGLTYRREEGEEIAVGFGEIFVETDPPGADVYVNNVNRGSSPLLITKIPLGFARIESRKGDLYGMEEVRITRSSTRLFIRLVEQYGNLYIQSDADAVEVMLDGESIGPITPDLIEGISVGKHIVELKGEGLYWVGEVTIQLGTITQIEAVPRPVGSISYSLPPGVSAEIKGESFEQLIQESGTLRVWTGTYTVQTASEIYEPHQAELVVNQGDVVKLEPALVHTIEYEHEQFSQALADMESKISGVPDITEEDVNHLVGIKGNLQSAFHEHPELVAKSELLITKARERIILQEKRAQVETLTQRQMLLEDKLIRMGQSRKARNLGKWLSLGTGVVGFGTSTAFFFLADNAYEEYLNATITSDVIRYRDKVTTCKTCMYVGLSLVGAGFGSYLTLWFTQRKERRYQEELSDIEYKIKGLQSELK